MDHGRHEKYEQWPMALDILHRPFMMFQSAVAHYTAKEK